METWAELINEEHDEEDDMLGVRIVVRRLVVAAWVVTACFLGQVAFAAQGQGAAGQAKPTTAGSVISEAGAMEGYQIGAGDVLAISVWNNPDLTRVVPVLPDGKISFPLIGELKVSDLTVPQLMEALKKALAPYAPNPQLSVEVQQTRSLTVYVIGKVNRPGNFSYTSNIDVLQALSMAGGLNPFAKRSSIKILRTTKTGKKEIAFDYDAVTEDGELEQNIELQRGDVVIVP